MSNPAVALRARLAPLHPRGLFRWDASGRALLVSDALRRTEGEAFRKAGAAMPVSLSEDKGLLYIDLPQAAYHKFLESDFFAPGDWREDWFPVQSLLSGILSRTCREEAPLPDIPLLRAAMLSCARGEAHARLFLDALRQADAVALRVSQTASCRACATLLAHWLWTERGVGLPTPVASTIVF